MPRFLAPLCALFATCVLAQTPYLVKDIKTAGFDAVGDSWPSGFIADGDSVYFSATTNVTGYELWVYRAGSATLLKDIAPGSQSSTPSKLQPIGGGVFVFSADDGVHGRELWRTDGTSAGTTLVRDVDPAGNGNVRIMGVFDGRVYFAAGGIPSMGPYNGADLWVSDGTSEGTRLVKDFDPYRPSEGAMKVVGKLGSRLLVVSNTSLWLTDGTEVGTTRINATVGYWANSAPIIVGVRAFFMGFDEGGGCELWVTDGTDAGTRQVVDLWPGSASGVEEFPMAAFGNGVLFFGNGGSSYTAGLYRSDGTAAGTVRIAGGIAGGGLLVHSGIAYISSSNSIWRTDGTTAGTYELEPSSSWVTTGAFVAFQDKVYYSTLNELKVTDGTKAGTTTAMTFAPLFSVGMAFSFTGGRLYFRGSGRYGIEPYVTDDGTAATTRLLAALNPEAPPSSSPANLVAAGDQVFFYAYDDNGLDPIWRSDGTDAGTNLVKSLPSGRRSQESIRLTAAGELAYWTLEDEFWRSDGTVAGTWTIKDLSPAIFLQGSSNGLLYVEVCCTVASGSALWRTDGTVPGTFAIQPLGEPRLNRIQKMEELAGRQYLATSGTNGLWKTDGLPGSTMYLGGDVPMYSSPEITAALGALYFAGYSPATGQELWRSDGTPEGTSLLKDLWAGSNDSSLRKFAPAGAFLFFVARTAAGVDLWRTDGTGDGTLQLLSIPESQLSTLHLTPVGDRVFFAFDDGIHGLELWQSDGTPEGTRMVADLFPGSSSSLPEGLTAADGEVFFAASDGLRGRELWRSDGTSAGTALVADLAPGAASSSPASLVVAGRRLFFRANDGIVGSELWALPLAASAFSIADQRASEGNSETSTLRFTVQRRGDLSSQASVSFAAIEGSALAETDFTSMDGTLTFLPGEASKNIDVVLRGDAVNEPEETFFVVLSSPIGASISRARAIGIIVNDDQSVDLAVAISLSQVPGFRYFLVTNNGSSTATGVQLHTVESPIPEPFHTIPLLPIMPGHSLSAEYFRGSVIKDVDRAPGNTVTATVMSTEPDVNPADNAVTGMTDSRGGLLLPSFLEVTKSAAGTAIATVAAPNIVTDSLLAITSVSGPESPYAALTLQAGPTEGRADIHGTINGLPISLTYPIVASGQMAKLDTGLNVDAMPGIYGAPLQVPIFIRGAKPDGTLPTGNVVFKDAGGSVLGQAVLDANGSAVFTRSALSVGTWKHSIEYSGDANFNPMRGIFNLTFKQAPTTITSALRRTTCTTAEGQITVKAASGTAALEGALYLYAGGRGFSYVLTSTGRPGEATAMVRINVPIGTSTLQFTYAPWQPSAYAGSTLWQPINFAGCDGLGSALHVITPCRIVDTRNPAGPFGGPSLAAAAERVLQVSGRCGIPATARAISANVTVVTPTATGYLRLLASGVLPRPSTSTVSYRMGKTRANNTIITLNSDGAIDVYNGGIAAVHFIIDVSAYFQ